MEKAKVDNTKLPFLEKVFCFLIVWGSGTQFTLQFSYIYYAIAFTFVLIVLSGKFLYNNKMTKPLIGVLFLTGLSVFLNIHYMGGTGIISTFNNFIIIMFSILFAMNKPYLNPARFEVVIKVFLFFSFLSTFLFIIYSLGFLPVKPVLEESHVSTFLYLLNVAPSDILYSVDRNGGIYWEPGMYQVFLTFFLIYYLFNKQLKHRNTVIIYLVVMIVTTISVSGYALTLMIFGLYALGGNNKNKIFKYVIRGGIVIALLLLIPIVTELLVAKEDTGSFGKRSLDLVLAWEVFLKHPILGYGIVNDAYDKAYLEVVGVLRPSSNGLMNLLMGTGILGAIFFILCYIRTLKFFSKEYVSFISIPLLIWLLVSINTEPIQYQPFLGFLFGIGLAYQNRKYVRQLYGY